MVIERIFSQISLCSKNYQKWKELALTSDDKEKMKKYMEKAFFWLELQTAFLALWAIENLSKNDPEIEERIVIAKSNLSKKLADYAKKILNEIKW